MIKIIKGVYGVKRVDSKSAPFTLSKNEEARLVSLGVAEYVTVPEEPDTPTVDAPVEEETTVDTPVEEVPVEEETTVDTPVVEVPVEEETTVDAPVEEVKKATAKKTTKKAKK